MLLPVLLAVIAAPPLSPENGTFLSRNPLPVEASNNFLGVAVDLWVGDGYLFQLENRNHRLLRIALADSLDDFTVLAEKGEGPGELFAPYRIAGIEGKGFVVVDVRGISLFDSEGRFVRRIRKFSPTIAIAVTSDHLFHATTHARSPFLIEALTREGEKVDAFLDRLIDVASTRADPRRLTAHLEYMNAGYLLCDGQFLYFLNKTMLRFLKMDLEGKVLLDKDMAKEFGPKGLANVHENEKYLENPSLMENHRGYFTFFLFSDAYLTFDGRIYLLRTAEPDLDMASEVKEIIVLDTERLEIETRYTFRVEKGERAYSMAVEVKDDMTRILLNMETNSDADVRLIELKPSNAH